MENAVNWFEIPAADFERAIAFYQKVMACELVRSTMDEAIMAMFPTDGSGVGGCVVSHPAMKPSAEGTCVYLNAGTDLAPALSRVEPAGGSIVVPRTKISDEIGYFAVFIDSEGNRVGLHSTR